MAPVAKPRKEDAPGELRGVLFFEDGSQFHGVGFGAETQAVGEVVFTTGMAGYPEAISDPSYRGQILLFTYPLQGNYGLPSAKAKDVWGFPAGLESSRVQPRAVIVRSLTSASHWTSARSLPEWLASEGIPGVAGLDTRALTERLRSRGVERGVVAVGKHIPGPEELQRLLRSSPLYHEEDLVGQVAPRNPTWVEVPDERRAHRSHGKGRGPLVAVLDLGCKASILRNLLARGADVLRWPPGEALPERWEGRKIAGYLVSNGPGDPARLSETIARISERPTGPPLLGVCLGHQLLALSTGARTYKMKYGHRGQNKPVLFLQPRGRAYILSENHGYAVEKASLRGTGLRELALNPDDQTVEGIVDTRGHTYGIQGHPEGAPGPRDAAFLFDEFLVRARRGA